VAYRLENLPINVHNVNEFEMPFRCTKQRGIMHQVLSMSLEYCGSKFMKAASGGVFQMPSPPGPVGKEDRYIISALLRGLDVLACFRSGETSLSNHQIAQRCGLPKSTVTRIVHTLMLRGYLLPVEPEGRYALGTATLALGSSMLARMDVRYYARPRMQSLADYSGATLALGVRDKLSVIYTEVARSTATLALTLQVGSRMPLATSAIGRAYLAASNTSEHNILTKLASDIDDSAGLAMRHGIEHAMEDFREYGCATSFGDWKKDINGIAVAFRCNGPIPLMVMNCGGPASTLSREFLLNDIRPRLLALVAEIESDAYA
jgi:DNA-binding IclR family transcriptional regulator